MQPVLTHSVLLFTLHGYFTTRSHAQFCSLLSTDPESSVKVYTDTIEGEPQVEQDVMEVEETLDDGTVVKRKIIKTRQKQTIVKRVVMEGPEGHLPVGTTEGSGDVTAGHKREVTSSQIALTSGGGGATSGSALDAQTQLQMYRDRLQAEPLQSTDVHVYEEQLPDGTVRKKRIVTTTEKSQFTERRVLEGSGAIDAMMISAATSDANISTPGDHPQIAPIEGRDRSVGCCCGLLLLLNTAVAVVCCCLYCTATVSWPLYPTANT